MKRLPWFRIYTESRNDSKLDALSDREFRIWYKLLCLAAESKTRGVIDYIDPEYVAMELRITVDELDTIASRLVRMRLILRSDDQIVFPSFNLRQYDKPSDEPQAVRERVRKSRMKRDVSRRTEQNRTENKDPEQPSDPVKIAEIIEQTKIQLGLAGGK